MLEGILQTLQPHQGTPMSDSSVKSPGKVPNKIPNKVPNKLRKEYPEISDNVWNVLNCIISDNTATAEEIGALLGISGRMVRKHIATLREAGLLVREGGAKGGHWRVVKP